jgi:hypothetical protein
MMREQGEADLDLARSIPARATVCFIWSAAHADFIAVGCAEEGYAGPCDAREIMIVRGDIVGKQYIELRRDRARQLRDSAAESFALSIAPMLDRLHNQTGEENGTQGA